MKEETFETAMQKHLADIESLPEEKRAKLLELADQTRSRHHQIQRDFRRAHDALDDWRLWAKYLLFDAEARLREATPPQTDPPQPS